MKATLTLPATSRTELGTSASRRIRRLEDSTPGVIYGEGSAATTVSIVNKDLQKAMRNELFFTGIVEIKTDASSVHAIVKSVQRHPVTGTVTHIDFQHVSDGSVVKRVLPILFERAAECKGVRAGGIVARQLSVAEVRGPVELLPHNIVVDLYDVGVGKTVYLSDQPLPDKVMYTEHQRNRNPSIVSLVARRGQGAAVRAQEEAINATRET